MMKLLRIEAIKLANYKIFLIFASLYLVFILGTFLSFNEFDILFFKVFSKEVFKFPYSWYNVTFLSKFFNLYLGIGVILIITNEYSYRTSRQNIIDGLSRNQFVYSKFMIILLLTIAATVLIGLVSLFLGLKNSTVLNSSVIFDKIEYLAGFFVHTLTMLSFAGLVAFLLRKMGLAIMVFLPYAIFVESIIRNMLPFEAVKYFPMKVINSIAQFPYLDSIESRADLVSESMPWENLAIGLGYAVLFFYLSTLLVKKRDF